MYRFKQQVTCNTAVADFSTGGQDVRAVQLFLDRQIYSCSLYELVLRDFTYTYMYLIVLVFSGLLWVSGRASNQ